MKQKMKPMLALRRPRQQYKYKGVTVFTPPLSSANRPAPTPGGVSLSQSAAPENTPTNTRIMPTLSPRTYSEQVRLAATLLAAAAAILIESGLTRKVYSAEKRSFRLVFDDAVWTQELELK